MESPCYLREEMRGRREREVMAAMRSTLPWVFGPPIDEEEEESMRRFRIECNKLFLEGHDPESIMDRWEDELKRRKSSSGTRIRCVVEKVGGVFYIRKVVEVVKEIHKGGEKEMANGDAPATAGQIWEGKRAVNGDASAVAFPACQISEEKEESSGDAPACAGAACQTREEKEAANGDAPTCAQIVRGFVSV